MALGKEMRVLINELADAVRSYYGVEIPITDINTVVENMGGCVIEKSSMESFSDGQIQKTGDDSFQIEISSHQTPERKNFTIAHELGHLFLHMGFRIDADLWNAQDERVYYRKGNTNEEYYANEFAAAFLMPEMDYKRIMDDNTQGVTVNTQAIARYFNVSTGAASNRGKWLGYLQW